jgi:hypothetical protein
LIKQQLATGFVPEVCFKNEAKKKHLLHCSPSTWIGMKKQQGQEKDSFASNFPAFKSTKKETFETFSRRSKPFMFTH